MKKKNFCQKALLIALSSLYMGIAQAQSYLPHMTLEGVTGSQTYGRLDTLIPLVPGCSSLFFADAQAKYGYDDAYYVGLGLGDRVISGDKILGGYLFLDYNQTRGHHDYWILGPGVELLKACWDIRLNGYFPINGKRTNEGSFFPSGFNECGLHGDCSFVEFAGHQQFEHRFLRFEEVGPGADLVFGKKWGCNNLFQIGPYYYHMSDSNDIIGGVARVELPLRGGVSLVGEASYDNDRHGAAVMGLQYRFNNPQSCTPLCDRLYDQIYRYRGNLSSGAGIRVVHDTKDEGLFLRKENIFFFSESGTAVLGDPNAGTFENPFAPTEFTQANVIDIGRGTNLYFSTGTYSINPPAGSLQLLTGQSIYGRSEDFKCTVNGDERPILLGGIQLLNSADNTIDSIQLRNIQTNPTFSVVGINAIIVSRLNICNSDILAEADFIGDAPTLNLNSAVGIGGSNTGLVDVVIDNSRITALANVTGNNSGLNLASAVGNTNLGYSHSQFTINNSELNSIARIGLNNTAAAGTFANNMATGIGLNITISGDFFDNKFILNNVAIDALAQVGGDNAGEGVVVNLATGIGNNISSDFGDIISGSFQANDFRLNCVSIESNALVGRDNINLSDDVTALALNMATGIGQNETAQIVSIISGFFSDNIFEICNSEIDVTAGIGRDNINPGISTSGGVFNVASGIGNNVILLGISASIDGSFTGNEFSIDCSQIQSNALIANNNLSSATVEGIADNMATGIGNNGANSLAGNITTTFLGSRFKLNATEVLAFAIINNDNRALSVNLASNLAVGMGNNSVGGSTNNISSSSFGSDYTITNSHILSLAQINNDSSSTGVTAAVVNESAGFGGNIAALELDGIIIQEGLFTSDTNITSTQIEAISQIRGNNLVLAGATSGAFNLATGLGNTLSSILTGGGIIVAGINDNLISICDTSISARAHIVGDNSATGTLVSAFNDALGLGNNVDTVGNTIAETFNGTLADINCSSITAEALVEGSQNINGFNIATGVSVLSEISPSTVSIFNSVVGASARVKGSNQGLNFALGLSADGLDTTLIIFDSLVNVIALADGTNDAVATEGQVIATNTIFNVIEN